MFPDHGLSRFRLRLPFVLLAVLITVVMTAGAGALVWQSRQSVLAEAHASTRGTARALSRHVFHVVRSSEVLLEQMLGEVREAGGIDAVRRNDARIHETIVQLVRPLTEVNTAVLADADGNLLAASGHFPVPAVSYADRAWFQAHRNGADFVIGDPITSRTSGAPIITISRALRDASGRLQAVALVGVEISYLEKLFAETHTDDGRAVTLFRNSDATLIARNPPEPPGKRYPNAPVVARSRSETSGSMIVLNSVIDGLDRLNAWDRVGDYPLVVVVGQSVDKVLAPWRSVVVQVAGLLSLVVAALLLAGRLALVGIRREEAGLSAAQEARTRAENTARELSRANKSLASVLAAAPEGIVGVDANDRAMFVNDAALALLGFERDELVGRVLHDLIHHHRADGSPYPAAECAMRNAMRTSDLCTIVDEVYWRKDGTSFPVEYTAGRLDQPDGGRGSVIIFRDISARRRMEEELKRSNADLEQFAYAVSHDLHEPLRTISGFVGLLKRSYAGQLPSEAIEFIDMAVDGVKRMTGMIDDLLAYSRIGRADISPVPVNLGDCAARARASLGAAIDEAGATVTIGPLPEIVAIESQMISLLQNLLGNAVKYRAPDRPPCVEVTAQREGSHWKIRVADNGIGIPAQDRERVFQVFQRLHRRGISGSGVGLALCRRIAERHHGSITIEDREDGQPGSVFVVRLPAL
ncbi:MAG TPA: ATP-binding protein [Magnetospirillum sp.]|nr:ATP-binding protein [Magnetospirillum sp.]